MIPQSVPPINSRVTIVIEDSCNSCCLPWNRNKSLCRSTKEKTDEISKTAIVKKDSEQKCLNQRFHTK